MGLNRMVALPSTVRCLKSGVTSSARCRTSTSRSGAYFRCADESIGARKVADLRHSMAVTSVSARVAVANQQTASTTMRRRIILFIAGWKCLLRYHEAGRQAKSFPSRPWREGGGEARRLLDRQRAELHGQ